MNKIILAKFTDNYTIHANSAEMERLLAILENESETVIKRNDSKSG